jgi:hypothetical protein
VYKGVLMINLNSNPLFYADLNDLFILNCWYNSHLFLKQYFQKNIAQQTEGLSLLDQRGRFISAPRMKPFSWVHIVTEFGTSAHSKDCQLASQTILPGKSGEKVKHHLSGIFGLFGLTRWGYHEANSFSTCTSQSTSKDVMVCAPRVYVPIR